MARLIGILVAIASLAACSSGVSNSGAGAAGTNCKGGDLNLICTANISFDSTSTATSTASNGISIDAYASDTNGDGQPDELVATDLCTLNISITDPLGTFAHTFEGVTFETFDISYATGKSHAPTLGTRRYTNTVSITLSGNVGSGSVVLPCVDLVTKDEFVKQNTTYAVVPYVLTIRATGRDFATNSVVVVTARINIEIGDFVSSVPTAPSTSSASVIDYRAGLIDVAKAGTDASNVRWQ